MDSSRVYICRHRGGNETAGIQELPMDLHLADKRALVTGSTSGIGAEIARMLALEGVKVVVHGRDLTRAQALVADIEARGGQAAAVVGDLMIEDGIEAAIKGTESAFG